MPDEFVDAQQAEAEAEAERRVEEARAATATELSLEGLRIRRLPDGLAKLTGLKSLHLSRCWQLQDLQPLDALTGLESLDLSRCYELRDIRPLALLTGLRSLDLNRCAQLQDLLPLAALTGLRSLNLAECRKLRNLQPLAALMGLQSLNLAECREVRDLQPLATLAGLRSLDLSHAEQFLDLQPLASLQRLQSLDLSGCYQLQNFQPLAALSGLQSLDLSGCYQLQNLQPLAALTGLQSISVSWCDRLQDLQPLAALTGLQSVSISYCRQLRDLRPLARLRKLRKFRCWDCELDCSPDAQPMSGWPLLAELYASRLLGAPAELGSRTYGDNALPGVRAWQQDLLAGEAPNSGVKVLILGNGSAGKTQIWRRLTNLPYDPSIPSTHGIGLGRVCIAPAQADVPEITARLWDFGGQSIHAGTHGLFLDERAIYVICWTPAHENTQEPQAGGIVMHNRPLASWLEYVRSLAGSGVPVLVVQTQCDRESDVELPPLPANHGFERLRVADSSAKQPEGIDRLQLELKSAGRYQLEQYGKVRLPQSWCDLGSELEAMRPRKTMPRGDFEDLCRKHGIAAPSAVLEYFHRSGQVFYRDGAFGNQVVLDLDWALEGVHAVFDWDRTAAVIRSQGGLLTARLLSALVWQQYQPAEHRLFLDLMKQCQICFEVADGIFIAPALLPSEDEVRTRIEGTWRGATPDASAELRYPFLHEGVLRGVLRALGDKAGEHGVYWSYGVCFYDRQRRSAARIRSRFEDAAGGQPQGTLLIETAGGDAAALAAYLVDSIREVNIGTPPDVAWLSRKQTAPSQSES